MSCWSGSLRPNTKCHTGAPSISANSSTNASPSQRAVARPCWRTSRDSRNQASVRVSFHSPTSASSASTAGFRKVFSSVRLRTLERWTARAQDLICAGEADAPEDEPSDQLALPIRNLLSGRCLGLRRRKLLRPRRASLGERGVAPCQHLGIGDRPALPTLLGLGRRDCDGGSAAASAATASQAAERGTDLQ